MAIRLKLKNFNFVIFLSIVSSILTFGLTAQGAENTACYQFKVNNDVGGEDHDHGDETRFEKWCYRSIENTNELFIYNVDGEKVLPELSMLIDKNGIMTHGSLAGGEVTIHKVSTKDFIPFTIPIQEPMGTERAFLTANEFSTMNDSANQVLNQFRESKSQIHSFAMIEMKPMATANRLPFRGYWWPRGRSMPMLAVMRKYDAYVGARQGNPGATAAENARHPYTGSSWGGHCNGWAAASIMRAEPRAPRTDATSGITFSVSDQKGLLAELDYCVSTAFFGHRNYGAGNNGDIRPELFHKTVLYYIGNLKKPVVMDYMPSNVVDNHPVSAYTMNIQQNGPNSQIVTATMTFHKYDKSLSNAVGMAPKYTRVYKYNLRTDSAGNPIGGSWISTNPDFVWVPLGPARCSSNNQRITSAWIKSILGI